MPPAICGAYSKPLMLKQSKFFLGEYNYADKCEVRLFENLLSDEAESSSNERAVSDEFLINPNSKIVLENAYIEKGLNLNSEERYQFMRNGYFCLDKDTTADKTVFNRIITLKETKKAK